jgi:hypothetical protein
MSKWICQYCGQDTSDVDYDYLVGNNHLACILLANDDKGVKIENWNKLDNKVFEIAGVPMRVSGTQILESRYTIDVYEMVDGDQFVRVDLWADNMELSVKIFPPKQFTTIPIHLERYVVKEHLKDPTIFLSTVESLVITDTEVKNFLTFLRDRLNSKNGKTGIVSHVINNGSTMTFGSASLW